MRYSETIVGASRLVDKRFTAFCGLCCLDCVPSNETLFGVVKELEQLLAELQFEHYAELKSRDHKALENYPQFMEVLKGIQELRCNSPCREGGGKPDCRARECVLGKGIEGCWECDDRKDCQVLEPLKKIHPNLEYHLELIKEHGPENCGEKRRSHYWWQEATSD